MSSFAVLGTLLTLVAGVSAVFLLPGYLLARRCRGRGRGSDDRVGIVAATLGFAAIVAPAAVFVAGAVTLRPIDWRLALGVAAGIAALLHAEVISLTRSAIGVRTGARRTPRVGGWEAAALAVAGAAFAYQFVFFDGGRFFHFQCIYRPCALAVGLGDAAAGGLNLSLFDADHQRMGLTAMIAPWMGLFGMAGLRTFWGLIMALPALFAFATARRLGASGPAALAAALVAAALPSVAGVQDQNRAVLAATGFVAFLAAWAPRHATILGGVAALAWAAEPALIVTAPALMALQVLVPVPGRRAGAARWAYAAALVLGFVVAGAPFMARLTILRGSPLTHEHFLYVPTQAYRLFGRDLALNAFLNWPFRDQVVRSPYNPLPNLALVPLMVLRHFGIGLAAVAACGLAALIGRRRWRFVAAIALFTGTIVALLAVNENWTQRDKWDIVVMAYAPLYLLVAFGADWLAAAGRCPGVRLGGVALAVAGLLTAHHGLARVPAPLDAQFVAEWSRHYQALPPEDPAYLRWERAKVREVPLLPTWGQGLRPTAEAARYALHDLGEPDLTRRLPSLALLFHRTYLGGVDTAGFILPEGFDFDRMVRDAREAPVAFTFDPAVPPTGGFAGATGETVERPACGAPDLHLYAFQRFATLRVPWNPWPIQAGLIHLPWAGQAVLFLTRTRIDGENPLAPKGPVAAPRCVAVHLPPGTAVELWDAPTLDPFLTYAYRRGGATGEGVASAWTWVGSGLR